MHTYKSNRMTTSLSTLQVLRESVFDAFYKLTDSHYQIRSYIFDVVRATVPRMNLDDVFTVRSMVFLIVWKMCPFQPVILVLVTCFDHFSQDTGILYIWCFHKERLNRCSAAQSKEDIAIDVKKELTKSMGSFGHVIIKALVTDIEPAAKVKQAMNEINAATRLRYVFAVVLWNSNGVCTPFHFVLYTIDMINRCKHSYQLCSLSCKPIRSCQHV